MSKYSPELLELTADIWEPRLGYRPTTGECEEMIRNVTSLFSLLMEWENDKLKQQVGEDGHRYSTSFCENSALVNPFDNTS